MIGGWEHKRRNKYLYLVRIQHTSQEVVFTCILNEHGFDRQKKLEEIIRLRGEWDFPSPINMRKCVAKIIPLLTTPCEVKLDSCCWETRDKNGLWLSYRLVVCKCMLLSAWRYTLLFSYILNIPKIVSTSNVYYIKNGEI